MQVLTVQFNLHRPDAGQIKLEIARRLEFARGG
jgi:hypothetical protein